MKYFFIVFLFCIVSTSIQSQNITLDEIRRDYSLCAQNKELCEKWYQRFMNDKSNLSPKLKAYKGGIIICMARFSPTVKKLPFVIQGKKLIEESISLASNDAEIRFIRYSVQKHLPPALAYNNNLEEDKKFISSHLDQFKSEEMRIAVKKMLDSK